MDKPDSETLRAWYRRLAAYAEDAAVNVADPRADWCIRANNPYCGDDITLYVRGDATRCRRIRYDGSACQVCRASTALMAGLLQDTAWARFEALAAGLDAAFATGSDQPLPEPLALFEAVRRYPVRRQCAALPWQALARYRREHVAASRDEDHP